MVSRLRCCMVMTVLICCMDGILQVENRRFSGMCGGIIGNTEPEEKRAPEFKSSKVKRYSYALEKDVPLIRPQNMAFTMKVWPTKNLHDNILTNETLRSQYYRVINSTVAFFESLLGRYPHNQTRSYIADDCLKNKGDVFLETGNVLINVTGYDYHLVVDTGLVNPCGEESDTLGWAGSCANAARYIKPFDKFTPRLIGLIYLCHNKISGLPMEDRAFEQTITHEVLHNLGISNEYLNDPETQTVTLNWTSAYGTFTRDFIYNTNPLATEAARAHFNCSTLIGAEVEDSGGGGTSGSHWEMRIFGPELMAGMISRRSYFSNISLSFLRGLLYLNGSKYELWYPWVNISMKQDYWYGRNAGCTFAQRSCKEYIDRKPMRNKTPRAVSFPFASTDNVKAFLKYLDRENTALVLGTCSPDRASVLTCSINHGFLVSNNESQQKFLYYDGERLNMMQGKNELTEMCPVYSDMYDRQKDTYCTNEFSKPAGINNAGGELFGAMCICFEQAVPFTKVNCNKLHILRLITGHGQTIVGFSGAGCYQYTCKHNRLMVQAAGGENGRYGRKVCWSKGTKIVIRRMIDGFTFVHGQLICPSCTEICGSEKCEPDVYGIEPRDQLESPCVGGAPLTNTAQTTTNNISWIIFIFLIQSICLC